MFHNLRSKKVVNAFYFHPIWEVTRFVVIKVGLVDHPPAIQAKLPESVNCYK